MTNIRIRNAEPGDSSAMAGLITQLGYPTTVDEMAERLSRILPKPEYNTFVAESGDEIVGMLGVMVACYYEKNGVYGRLATLVVDERYRSQGVGKALVERGESWLREQGVAAIIVNSGIHREAARRFYLKSGYEETGRRFVKTIRP